MELRIPHAPQEVLFRWILSFAGHLTALAPAGACATMSPPPRNACWQGMHEKQGQKMSQRRHYDAVMDTCLDNLLPQLKVPSTKKTLAFQEPAAPEHTLEEKIPTTRRQAEAGNHDAQLMLGMYYAIKLKRCEAADPWFHCAVANGNVGAAFWAGLFWGAPSCSPTGTVSEADQRRSYDWYRQARKLFAQMADSATASDLYNLAWMCEEGCGGPVDVQAAARWYRAAIRKGSLCHDKLLRLLADDDVELLDEWEEIRCVLALRRSRSDKDQAEYRQFRDWLLALPRSSMASDRALYQEIRAYVSPHVFRLIIRPLPPPWQSTPRPGKHKPRKRRVPHKTGNVKRGEPPILFPL